MLSHKIFYIRDLNREIGSYLNMEEKSNVNKIFDTNCFITYNYTGNDYMTKTMDNISSICNFEDEDEEVFYQKDSNLCEYLGWLSSSFTHELDVYYDNYYGYDWKDYANDHEYNNISYTKMRELGELCLNTYMTIYARKLVECIENKKLSTKYLKYDIFALDEELPIDIHKMVIEYYKQIFVEDVDIDIFCERCGSFGHHDVSNECIFFNPEHEKKRIYEEVKTIKNKLVSDVVKKEEEEIKQQLKREKVLCISCKTNNRGGNCLNNKCRTCCKCNAHRKRGKKSK